MIEEVEEPGSEEPLELEGTQEEFSKCRNSKIKYTRALLLELTEVEVCRKLPSDFDVLILRQLHEGSDDTVEHKSIFGKPFDHGPLLTTTLNLAFPGERWDSHLFTQSIHSHSQRNCSLERKAASQPIPHKSEKDAGVLHCDIPKTHSFQLSKTQNPYRPPHLSKKMPQPLATFYEPRVKSSGESDQKGSTDDITGHAKSGYDFVLAVADDSTKESLCRNEAFGKNKEGNEVTESSESLDKCEEFWRGNEGNEVIGANKVLEGVIEDNQPTFDDYWAEILDIIHLQLEPNMMSPMDMNIHADSDVEIHFPDEESLTSVDPLPNLKSLNLDASNDVANSEAEIIWPDEGSLITIHDMIAFDSSMPTVNSGSMDADIADIAVENINNSKPAKLDKPNDWSKRLHHIAQPSPNLSRWSTRGQPHSLLPPSLTSMDIFGPGFLPFCMDPNLIPYIRCLNCFTQSDFHLPFCPETTSFNTNTTDSVSQYSLLHQPNIFLQQPNHQLFDTTCADPTNLLDVYNFDAMQFVHPTSQQEIHEGFGKSKAVVSFSCTIIKGHQTHAMMQTVVLA